MIRHHHWTVPQNSGPIAGYDAFLHCFDCGKKRHHPLIEDILVEQKNTSMPIFEKSMKDIQDMLDEGDWSFAHATGSQIAHHNEKTGRTSYRWSEDAGGIGTAGIQREKQTKMFKAARSEVANSLKDNYSSAGEPGLVSDISTSPNHPLEVTMSRMGLLSPNTYPNLRSLENYANKEGIMGVSPTTRTGWGHTAKMPGGSHDLPTSTCQRGRMLAKKGRKMLEDAESKGVKIDPSELPLCTTCYAQQGNMPNSQNQIKYMRNFLGLAKPKEQLMIMDYMLKRMHPDEWFRLFGSGDLQGLSHIAQKMDLARLNPLKKIWLPTHEPDMLFQYLKQFSSDNITVDEDKLLRAIPSNVSFRVSEDYAAKLMSDKLRDLVHMHPNVSISTKDASHLDSGRDEMSDPTYYFHGSWGNKEPLETGWPAMKPYPCPVSYDVKSLLTGEKGCDSYGCRACWNNNIKIIDYNGHGALVNKLTRIPRSADDLQHMDGLHMDAARHRGDNISRMPTLPVLGSNITNPKDVGFNYDSSMFDF